LDEFPEDATEWMDSDGDEQGDNADTDDDNDGMPDAWEEQYGFNSTNGTDSSLDTDGDGYSNLMEYEEGTDPLDAESKPTLLAQYPMLIVQILLLAFLVSGVLLSLKLGKHTRPDENANSKEKIADDTEDDFQVTSDEQGDKDIPDNIDEDEEQ
jgi:hypothetical protein